MRVGEGRGSNAVRRFLALAVLVAAPAAFADSRGRIAGRALPVPVVPEAEASGNVALVAPLSEEVLFPGGDFTMGSSTADVLDGILLCKGETTAEGACELPLLRESIALTQSQGEIVALDTSAALQLELPQHDVSLSPFWIDRHEVTVGDYRRCVEAGACTMPSMYTNGAERYDKPSLPIVFVTWDDARAYCQFRGGRLPTEAEWERAARGRTGRRFPWGNVYGRKLANHGSLQIVTHTVFSVRQQKFADFTDDEADGARDLAPVGSFPDGRTPEGLDDMAGNAAEWIFDGFAKYEEASAHNPTGNAMSGFKVLRGGSFVHGAPWMRAAARLFARASERAPWIGFRCARDAS